MAIELVMLKPNGTRKAFPVKKPTLVIGRKNSCDLRIPLPNVSRQHCRLTVSGDQISVTDLGSSNGTFHNGEKVETADLKAGDKLSIGPVVFTLVVDGQPESVGSAVPAAFAEESGAHNALASLDRLAEDLDNDFS